MLTRNRADAELHQAGEREGGGVAEKDSDSRLGSPGGNTQRAAGQGGDSVSSGNLFPPRQQGDPAEPSLLRSGSWGTGTGSEEPAGEQGGGEAFAHGSTAWTPPLCVSPYPVQQGHFTPRRLRFV